MKNIKVFLAFSFIALLSMSNILAQLTSQQVIEQMGRGINLGNTLDAREYEGYWNTAQESNFDDYLEAGFTCVRIPITWNNHVSNTSPYTIDPTFFNRVEEVVEWGLSRKLIIVINAHHEEWIKDDPSAQNMNRLDSIWSQVATCFKDKSDSLLFEILNEPYPMSVANVNIVNSRVLSIIRKTNPTRNVLFSGNKYSNTAELISIDIPNDPYLIGYFHSYNPWEFAGEGNGTWGSPSDISSHKTKFNEVETWSTNNNIPVFMGEFGARVDKCDFNSSMRHYAFYVEESIKNGWAFAAWDDNGWFQVLKRSSRTWQPSKDVLVNFSKDNPTDILLTNKNAVNITISWNNRVTSNNNIVIQRGSSSTNLVDLVTLPFDAVSYIDTDIDLNKTYYYRVVAQYDGLEDLLSYPQEIKAEGTGLSSTLSLESDNYTEMYPNPATNYLIVRNHAPDKYINSIIIYNISGMKVFEQDFGDVNSVRIATESLEQNTYIIEIVTNKSTSRKKFIKL